MLKHHDWQVIHRRVRARRPFEGGNEQDNNRNVDSQKLTAAASRYAYNNIDSAAVSRCYFYYWGWEGQHSNQMYTGVRVSL